jgi:phage tail sheath protein FI
VQDGQYARTAAMFAPWVKVPGPLQGQERTVPPSAVAAGLMARNDLAGVAPDEPAANTNGDSATATSLSVTSWTDANRETLNDAGVDAFKSRRGTITLWGYRTLYDPDIDQKWVELGAARVLMQIIAELEAVSEQFVLRRMDGKYHLLTEYANAHLGVLKTHYDAGSLADQRLDDGTVIPATAYTVSPSWDADTREMSDDVLLRVSGMVETARVRLIRRAAGEAL